MNHKSVLVLLLFGCIVLGASVAFAGVLNVANSDPAPGRSPGPPVLAPAATRVIAGMRQFGGGSSENGEHGDIEGGSPTYIFTKDDTDNGADDDEKEEGGASAEVDSKIRSPLTSNDVLDAAGESEGVDELVEPEVDRPEEEDSGDPEPLTGDVNSESSGGVSKNQKSDASGGNEEDERGSNWPCSHSVENYLKADDKIVRIVNSGGGNSVAQKQGEEAADIQGNNRLQVEITHDVYDTGNGIVPGVIYRVEVHRQKGSDIRDFYIESSQDATRRQPVGHFLDSISHPGRQSSAHDVSRYPSDQLGYPAQLPANTWIDDLEADWASEHPAKGTKHPQGSSRSHPEGTAVRWNSIHSNVEAYFDEGEDGSLDELGDIRECPRNVWQQDLMFNDRMMMNWTVSSRSGWSADEDDDDSYPESSDSESNGRKFGSRSSSSSSSSRFGTSNGSLEHGDGQRNRTVYFRILYRTMTSHIVYELIYTMVLLKECNLLLKDTSGSFDSGKLPSEYDDECRISFPRGLEEDQEQQQQQQQQQQLFQQPSPPGLVIQLTRLNIPCRRVDGGYLKFLDSTTTTTTSEGDPAIASGSATAGSVLGRGFREERMLCGKLEELPKHERTFHFQRHHRTTVLVRQRPVFSFNFKLVDYCYNVTLSDRNGSVMLRPKGGLECRFKIHLPFGNRVQLRLVANGVRGSLPNRTEQIDLSVPQQPNSDSYSSGKQCFSGLTVDVFEQPNNRWTRCIDERGSSTVYTLLSSDNSLVIQVSKYSLLAALQAAVSNGSSNFGNSDSSSSSSDAYLPSLLIEYDTYRVESVVSQCAFGWIATGSRLCVATFENRQLSWADAEQECVRRGGHLASIRSAADQKLIDQLLLKSPGYRDGNAYWIGATDRVVEGDFRWSNQLPFTYSNWFPGWIQQNNFNRQPNDDGLSGQDCVEIRRLFQAPPGSATGISGMLAGSYMWNDRDCETKNFFLCEKVIMEEAFEKTWHDDCNKSIALTLDRPKATIWSPGFPRPYPDNVNCLTMITAPPGYRIVLDFEELVLENEPLCAYDYLQIMELSSNFTSAYTKPARPFAPLFQTRNPRHSTNRSFVRRRKSNLLPTSKVDIEDRLMATLISKTPNKILQPEDPSYDLRLPPPELGTGHVPRKVCGDWSSKLKLLRHTTRGPVLALRFVSDYSNHFGGFKAKVAMENVISECYDERFKAYNASCYLFISYPEVDWMTAQQVCRGIGAQLASISTTDEQRFITANIRNNLDYTPRALYWVGGELSELGELEWTDGAKLQFEGWLPGQKPDPVPTQRDTVCLGLQWKVSPTPMISSGLHWTAQKCTTVGGYVCKKPRPTAEENMAKNQTLTGTEGRLLSPAYPNPYPAQTDYWIRLVAPESTRIIVQFQKLDIEHQEECLYDYVSIQNYQMMPENSLNPGTNPLPLAMYWEGRNDGLPPQSSDYVNDQPFRNLLNGNYYNDQKNPPPKEDKFFRKRSLSENSADIQQKLQDNIKLLEKINSKLKDRKKRFLSSDNYKTVKNSSQSITLESNSIDPMEPIEDTDPSFLPYVRWCGTHETNMTRFNFVSSGNEAFLRFHSDFSVAGSGYSATWTTVDISGCPVQTITSREGFIASPNYPHFLLNNLDCTFIIQAPFGKKVWLEFDAFDILQDAIVYVDISEGPFEPFRNPNHVNDGVFMSRGERLVVRLKTGTLPRGKGFHATFKTLSSALEQRTLDLTNRTAGGNLYHLNYPQSAPFEVDFIQHLIAPLGEVILLELHGVGFSEHGCHKTGFIEIYDNYADKNGTLWHLCELNHVNASTSKAYSAEYKLIENNLAKPAPIYITSYLNTLHIRQRNVQGMGLKLNATLRLQNDIGYKMKLITNDEEWVENCNPNPCQSGGKCIMQKDRGICQCRGYFTGRFCGLTMCELEPCYFGKCELTQSSFKCHCQPGYQGQRCDEKPKPCEDNPCEGRGECHPKNGGYFCRCHAWWEGPRCERRMMHIPYKPLSERMLQEPFWLGLITVFVVLAVIGLVWCAKRHFPEKIEKLLADETHRNRPVNFPPHHLNTALREQLQATAGTVPSSTATTPATHRTIFGRLGIRKPSILSLSSPQPVGGATARTFSLDDLLRPPPRRSPSPRKKRNNSTPTKKNVNEKKQILQQLVSPAPNAATKQVSLGELIQLSENRLKVNHAESESDLKETTFSEHSLSVSSMVRQISDPKLEKKVTFARLLSKVSAEMSSGSEDLANGTKHSSALSLPTEVPQRANSVPPSPSTNEIRSPHSTSSNQGSGSLSSSELALHDFGLRAQRRVRPKVSSADSILAMFKNFATSTAGVNLPSSIVISPSSTPTASSPQDDVAGDDDSSTSSIHTPVSFSSGAPDSPVFYRQSTIEVPVLDALSAHKTSPTTTATQQQHPPTILLEIPSNGINNKCLSPIREMPTPIPSPALTPIMPRPQRIRGPQAMHDESMSVTFSGDYSGYTTNSKPNPITIEINQPESDTDSPTPTNLSTDSTSSSNGSSRSRKAPPPTISISIDVQPPTPERERRERPRDLIIPELIIQQPSPTKERTEVVNIPGSPPPQRASIGETSFLFPNKQQQKRLLKHWEKPGSLDLPFDPPMITITANMSEVESDADCMSPACGPPGKPNGVGGTNSLGVSGSSVGMCYLSPFSMCTRGDRAPSESNLSSSGYSSMASPGPSRCGSSNPLCPSETDDPGSGPSGKGFPGLGTMLDSGNRRQASILKKHNDTGGSGTAGASNDRQESFRLRSDSETLSDDPLLESNDEGIGTDHLDEKIEDGEIKSAKELEMYISKELIETGQNLLNAEGSASMSQLQLPSIVIQSETGFDKLSPMSSRSESPLSDRTASMERFSPLFYGKKDQQLPFTDSDGLYDFPSSDGKGGGSGSTIHHRKSTGRRRERRSSRSGTQSLSPSKSTSVLLLDIPTNTVGSKDSKLGTGATPARKSPKRRPLYRHPIASSSSSTESLTSTREYAQRSSKAFVTFTRETHLCDSGDDTGEVRCSLPHPIVTNTSNNSELTNNKPFFVLTTTTTTTTTATTSTLTTTTLTTTATSSTTTKTSSISTSPFPIELPPQPHPPLVSPVSKLDRHQPEAPPRFACADSDVFRRLLNYKLDKLTSKDRPQTTSLSSKGSFGSYSYTRVSQTDDDDDNDAGNFDVDDDDRWDDDECVEEQDDIEELTEEEEDQETAHEETQLVEKFVLRTTSTTGMLYKCWRGFHALPTDVSSQILPKVTVEDISSKPPSKIGRLRAIGNQIRFLRRLERSIRQKDTLIAVSDEEGGPSPRESPRATSPLLRKQDSNLSPTSRGTAPRAALHHQGSSSQSSSKDLVIVVEAHEPYERNHTGDHRGAQPKTPQLLMPSSAAGMRSRQNFKMSRQKRVANSRGGPFGEQSSWSESREPRMLGADVNSD
ncbi:uncharacterized protein LOC129739391 isoform X3 [Uranotaenia lowii]|uniref:uncharacterized protein LOC129739391 isoform X3 n=1 Tax=Uranotaenia lowii TaxID=190385 RepID=UPI00247B2150|nr:uncharacterized protein LOC129739391 isoform X3 [Uranotaenia lowii]